jgi:tetratricopeptide (TPR) repeat protein
MSLQTIKQLFIDEEDKNDCEEEEEEVTVTENLTTTTIEAGDPRTPILNEIVDYERNYNRCLNILKQQFALLIKNQSTVTQNVYRILFPIELDIIIAIDLEFLSQLECIIHDKKGEITDDSKTLIRSSLGQSADPAILLLVNGKDKFQLDTSENKYAQVASVLLHLGHAFKLYTHYINKYDDIIATLDAEINRNKKLNQFLEMKYRVLKDNGESKVTLQDYLIHPVQTIPRYKMFLSKLLAYTDKTDEAYEKLTKALTLISDIAVFCNRKKMEYQNETLLVDLGKSLNLKNLFQPGRQLLFHSNQIEAAKDSTDKFPSDLYILSDCMVIVRKKKYCDIQQLCGKLVHHSKCFKLELNQHTIWLRIETTYKTGFVEKSHILCTSASIANQIEELIKNMNKQQQTRTIQHIDYQLLPVEKKSGSFFNLLK